MGKGKRKIRTNKHHIIPRSRGGSSSLENLAKVDIKKHEHYHALFDNRTPEEIINNLVRRYWKGNWDYVKDAYNKYKGL